MEKIKLIVFRILLKKYILGWLVKGWGAIKGYKTQLSVAAFAVVYLLEQTGQIPTELAKQIYPYLEAMAGFSLIQKLQRAEPYIEEIKKEL